MNIYHKRFLSSLAAENIVGLFSRYKGAHKEITESWAMLEAAKKFVSELDRHLIVVVGDGCSPRTGVVFAYFTKADVLSIDPNFNMAHWNEHVFKQTVMGFPPQRIQVIKDKIENIGIDCCGRPCVIVWPHTHADMGNTKINNYTNRTDIAMPCCVPIPKAWMEKQHIVFDDYNILSPKRTIHIWKQDIKNVEGK